MNEFLRLKNYTEKILVGRFLGLKNSNSIPSLKQYVHVFITHGYNICRIKNVIIFWENNHIIKIELFSIRKAKSRKSEAFLFKSFQIPLKYWKCSNTTLCRSTKNIIIIRNEIIGLIKESSLELSLGSKFKH